MKSHKNHDAFLNLLLFYRQHSRQRISKIQSPIIVKMLTIVLSDGAFLVAKNSFIVLTKLLFYEVRFSFQKAFSLNRKETESVTFFTFHFLVGIRVSADFLAFKYIDSIFRSDFDIRCSCFPSMFPFKAA